MRPNQYEDSRTTTSVSVDTSLLKEMKKKNINISRLLDKAMGDVVGGKVPKEIRHLTREEILQNQIQEAFEDMPGDMKNSILDRVRNDYAIPWVLKTLKREYNIKVLPKDLKEFVDNMEKQEEERIEELIKDE